MKYIINLLLLICLASTVQAQQKPPYDRTATNQVMADRATWSRAYMGVPKGATPSFPSYVPDSLKCGALFYRTTDSSLYVYNCIVSAWRKFGNSNASKHYADSLKSQILTGYNTYTGANTFTGTRFYSSEFHGGQHLDVEDYQGLSQYSPNARLRFSSAYGAGNDGFLYHGDELGIFNDPWLVLQIKNAGYKIFKDSLTRITDGKKALFQGDVPTAAQSNHYADSVKNALLSGNNTFSGTQTFNISNANQVNSVYGNYGSLDVSDPAGNGFQLSNGVRAHFYSPDTFSQSQIYQSNDTALNIATNGGANTTKFKNNNIYDKYGVAYLKSGGALVTKDHAVQGDSTIVRNIYFVGSSLTLGPPQALLTSDTSTYAYKIARAKGGKEYNLGVGSRTLQQVTVGDNSIYSNMASLPMYSPGDIIIIEGMVNDVVGDTTKYTVALHTSQFGGILNYLHTNNNWPLDPQHVIIFNPFYYNFTAIANHGNIAYRHSNYNAAEQALATSFGVGFLDLYSTEPHSYVYQDSLHSVGLGHTWAAGNFVTYSNAQSIPTYNYFSLKNKTVGSSITYGDLTVSGAISASGPLSAPNIKTPQLNVDFLFANKPVNFLNSQGDSNNRDINLGSNNGSPSITANTNKGGAIYGYAYGDGVNLNPTIRLFSYISSSTGVTAFIGSNSAGQGQPQALDIYGNDFGNTAVKRAGYWYLNTGDFIVGGGGTDAARFTVNQPTTGNGVAAVTAGSATVTGTGTLFTNTFIVGQSITINGETRVINTITNNTTMTTTTTWTNSFNGAYTLVGGNRLQVFGSGAITTAGFGSGLLHFSAAGVWSSSLVVGGDLSATIALPSGATATTQAAGTNNTSLATMGALFAERSTAFTYTNKTHDMLRLAAGANGGKGTATLVAGTVTVSNTAVTATSIIVPIRQTAGGTVGTLSYTVSAGSGFTITSSSSTDTSVITYLVIN